MAEDHVTNIKLDTVNAALAEVFMEKDMMTTPYNPIAINTGSKLAVIDTGTGKSNYKKSGGVGGQFVTNLGAAGIDRGAVDTVIISHYHGDHINGLLMDDNSLTYPNAEILVPAIEHAFWMDDGEMGRASPGRVQTNFKNVRRVFNPEVMKRVKTYEWDKEVIPGVTAKGTPGHTPGHTSYVVASGQDSVFVQSDVTHVPFLFVRHPDWHAFYDQDGAKAEATRRKVYDMLVVKSCGFRAFTTRSPRWRMSRNTAPAIAKFRLSGTRRFNRPMPKRGPWWNSPEAARTRVGPWSNSTNCRSTA